MVVRNFFLNGNTWRSFFAIIICVSTIVTWKVSADIGGLYCTKVQAQQIEARTDKHISVVKIDIKEDIRELKYDMKENVKEVREDLNKKMDIVIKLISKL